MKKNIQMILVAILAAGSISAKGSEEVKVTEFKHYTIEQPKTSFLRKSATFVGGLGAIHGLHAAGRVAEGSAANFVEGNAQACNMYGALATKIADKATVWSDTFANGSSVVSKGLVSGYKGLEKIIGGFYNAGCSSYAYAKNIASSLYANGAAIQQYGLYTVCAAAMGISGLLFWDACDPKPVNFGLGLPSSSNKTLQDYVHDLNKALHIQGVKSFLALGVPAALCVYDIYCGNAWGLACTGAWVSQAVAATIALGPIAYSVRKCHTEMKVDLDVLVSRGPTGMDKFGSLIRGGIEVVAFWALANLFAKQVCS